MRASGTGATTPAVAITVEEIPGAFLTSHAGPDAVSTGFPRRHTIRTAR
jgi:hypothetical protein